MWDIQENLSHIKAAHQSVCIRERDSRIADHQVIYNAIETSDANGARDAMRNHFKDLLMAMHEETERQAVEAAQKKVSEMRQRFSLGVLNGN